MSNSINSISSATIWLHPSERFWGRWTATLERPCGQHENLGAALESLSRLAFEARQLWGMDLPVKVLRGPLASAKLAAA